ncbi:hypothetical protein D3C80_1243760 [compost metagenome]
MKNDADRARAERAGGMDEIIGNGLQRRRHQPDHQRQGADDLHENDPRNRIGKPEKQEHLPDADGDDQPRNDDRRQDEDFHQPFQPEGKTRHGPGRGQRNGRRQEGDDDGDDDAVDGSADEARIAQNARPARRGVILRHDKRRRPAVGDAPEEHQRQRQGNGKRQRAIKPDGDKNPVLRRKGAAADNGVVFDGKSAHHASPRFWPGPMRDVRE